MARIVKSKYHEETRQRMQLVWSCVRLNPDYRRSYDNFRARLKAGVAIVAPKKDWEFLRKFQMNWWLPYTERNIFTALRKQFRFGSLHDLLPMLDEMQPAILDATTIDFVLPEVMRDLEIEKEDGGLEQISKNKLALMTRQFKRGTVVLKFSTGEKYHNVERVIKSLFDRLNNVKKILKIKNHSSKKTLTPDALKVYEDVHYNHKTLDELAKRQQTATQDFMATKSRIKKRYETAVRYIEKGGFRTL